MHLRQIHLLSDFFVFCASMLEELLVAMLSTWFEDVEDDMDDDHNGGTGMSTLKGS